MYGSVGYSIGGSMKCLFCKVRLQIRKKHKKGSDYEMMATTRGVCHACRGLQRDMVSKGECTEDKLIKDGHISLNDCRGVVLNRR